MNFKVEIREAFKKYGITKENYIEVLKDYVIGEPHSDLEIYLDEILARRLGLPVNVQVRWNNYLEEVEFVVNFSQKPSELFSSWPKTSKEKVDVKDFLREVEL